MEKSQVRLHGVWASAYSKRVELALRIKGIPYEYVEEDLTNKSQALLELNPVHKKIPVLVHDGKPICESLVILEYIDETWKNSPKLLPDDPYQRAQVRFWVSFIQQQLFDAISRMVMKEGETQAKAIEEVHESMQVLEEGLKEHFLPEGSSKIDENNLGLLDIMLYITLAAHESYDEAIGVKILDQEKHPLLFSWIRDLKELPTVKEVTPPADKLVAILGTIRQNALGASTSA